MGLNNSAWNKLLLAVVSFELMSQAREIVIPCLSPRILGVQMTRVAPGGCVKTMDGSLHVSAGSSLTRNFPSLQFQKDTKDAQELLKKVDTDLDQKFSPEFKDRYQLESLLRELDVSVVQAEEAAAGAAVPMALVQGHPRPCGHLAQLSPWGAAWPCCCFPVSGLPPALPSPLARNCLSPSNVIAHWAGFYLFSY